MLPARLDSVPMPLPDGLRLRRADAADLPRIAEMREAVGWSVHHWVLRAILEPPHARCLVAVDLGGRVIGAGSGISYGRLGFIGNMVVDSEHRRRGIGAAILLTVIEFLEARGTTRMELYATADGRPLYARHGFELTGMSALVRARRGIGGIHDGIGSTAGIMLSDAGQEAAEELLAYDAPRFGGDRGGLLKIMLDDPHRPLSVARHDGEMVGYGWIRPDGERVGPLLADTPDIAVALIGEAFDRLPSAKTLTLNLPPDNRAGSERLAQLGAELEPWDGRMARGPQIPRRDKTIYGNVVGALG